MKALQIRRSFSVINGLSVEVSEVKSPLTIFESEKLHGKAWNKFLSVKGTALEDRYQKVYDRCRKFYETKWKTGLKKSFNKLK